MPARSSFSVYHVGCGKQGKFGDPPGDIEKKRLQEILVERQKKSTPSSK